MTDKIETLDPLEGETFAYCKTNVAHMVLPDPKTGELSAKALCGYAATVETLVPRYAHGDARWEDGSKIFLGMGAIVRESNEGWRFGRSPDGVQRRLCDHFAAAAYGLAYFLGFAEVNVFILQKLIKSEATTRTV